MSGTIIDRESVISELKDIQSELRGAGEYRKANILDFAIGYLNRLGNVEAELESLRAENRRLKIEIAVLTNTPTGKDIVTAYKQAEAALGEMREVVEGIRDFAKEHNFMLDMWKIVDACEQALSSPTAKAAGERWRAMERVAEAARQHVKHHKTPPWVVDANAPDKFEDLVQALAAYEGVKE